MLQVWETDSAGGSIVNEEVTDWLEDRALDPERCNAAFGLRRASKRKRPVIRYPTPIGVDRVRFIDGEEPKYSWQRRGGAPHWYGLPQARKLLGDDDPLYIVNGEPSVWAAWQSGVPAVCTCGGETFMPTDAQFEHLVGLGHSIRVVYDADEVGERASRKLAEVLLEFGATVQVRRWREFLENHPETKDRDPEELAGFDVDDLHQITGDDALAVALEDLEIMPVERAEKPEPRRKSHWHLAETVLKRLAYRDGPEIVHAQSAFWRYEPSVGIWDRTSAVEFDQETGSLDGFVFTDGEKVSTLSLSANAIGSVRKCAVVQSTQEDFFEDAPRGVQFRNGFLDANTMKLRPSDPTLRQQFHLDAVYDPNAKCQVWKDALRATFFEDEDSRDKMRLLQEFAGAILVGRTGRVLFLSGGGGNGKSTVLDVFSQLVPREIRVNIAPHKLSSGHQAEYWVAQLAGKRLNVDADIPAGELLESSEFKKSVTGDELMGRDPAGKPFKFRPRILHLFSANELPGTRDHTAGFWRRIMAIEFDRDFEDDPHSGVSPELAVLRRSTPVEEFGREIFRREKAGIFAWAVRGAKRLLEQGSFTEPSSSADAMEAWRTQSDQVAMFLQQQCNTDVDYWTSASELHRHYDEWAKRTNHGKMSSTKFGRRMGTLGFTEKSGKKRRTSSGMEYRVARLAQVDDSDAGQIPF